MVWLGDDFGQTQVDTSGAIVDVTPAPDAVPMGTIVVTGQRPTNWVGWALVVGLAVVILWALSHKPKD